MDNTRNSGTAKRLQPKAQGCFNPGITKSRSYQPGTGCASKRNRVAVEPSIQFSNPGLPKQPWALGRNRFAVKATHVRKPTNYFLQRCVDFKLEFHQTQREAMFVYFPEKHVIAPISNSNPVHSFKATSHHRSSDRSVAWAPPRRGAGWFLQSRWERDSSTVQFERRRSRLASSAMNWRVDSENTFLIRPPATGSSSTKSVVRRRSQRRPCLSGKIRE